DCLSREGILRAARALPRVLTDPGDKQARHDLTLASLFGGLSLANGGLGAVHGFAGVIGGWTGAAHGAICGRLLPGVLKVNADALADLDQPNRMAEVAQLLGANDLPSAIQDLEDLLETGGVPRLKDMGLAEADLPAIAEASKSSSSMKGNPVALSPDQALAALTYAF
ncbi:MAG: iron-containing alcohol dehydrogenase, partial [Pseudomonadota bacterium]